MHAVEDEISFKYYEFGKELTPSEYEKYISEAIRYSEIDTGIRPMYGDQLLTLSTCFHFSAGGRFVVVARKVA